MIAFMPHKAAPGASPQFKDLIDQLLCKDDECRLGSNGSDDIKNHPFFNVSLYC
jgi:hypothetical protein